MAEADDDTTAITNATETEFPIVLFDGENEKHYGNLKIYSDLTFKEFQMKLSQLLGISYNNLTTYLVDSKKSKISPDRRKILITGKVNFAVIVREINCYFLVVLKRSRRDRRRKPGTAVISPDDLARVHRGYSDFSNDTYSPYYYDNNHDLMMMQRDNYNYNYMNMNMNMILSNSNAMYGFDNVSPLNLNLNFPAIDEVYPRVRVSNKANRNRSLCDECGKVEKQGKKDEFHHCVYDEVIVGFFRSAAGPIARPPWSN